MNERRQLNAKFRDFGFAGWLADFEEVMRIKSAELRMVSHDPKRIITRWNHQNWHTFRPVMHLHENHYTKRAGVAGIRARADIEIICNLLYIGGIERGWAHYDCFTPCSRSSS